jgi:hypothetical protein
MTSELRPCPFCNGTDLEVMRNGENEWIKCNTCACYGPLILCTCTGASATEAWNRRGDIN